MKVDNFEYEIGAKEKIIGILTEDSEEIHLHTKPNTLFSRDFFIKEPSGSSSIQGEDKDGK